MDETEMRRLYYLILVDSREDVRSEATKAFIDSKDTRLEALAAIGHDIFKVLSDQEKPESLEGASSRFENFPMDSFWRTFPETSGQELIKKSQTVGKGKKKLVKLGLELIAKSQDGGFLISDASVELVKSVKKEGGELAKTVLDYHKLMRPEKGVPKNLRRKDSKPPKGDSPRRNA
jgi:hypothetical protein